MIIRDRQQHGAEPGSLAELDHSAGRSSKGSLRSALGSAARRWPIAIKGLVVLIVAGGGSVGVDNLTSQFFADDSVPFAFAVMAGLALFVGGLYLLSGESQQ